MSEIEELVAHAIIAKQSYDRFKKEGIKSEGTKARVHLLNIKKLSQELRKELIAEMKKMPIKKRTKSELLIDEDI